MFAVEISTPSSAESTSVGVVGLDDDSNYRSPSVLAIISLVLGVVAPVALFAPLLLVIPIAAGLLALLAIRQINTSDGMMVGRAAACLGLALAIASIAAATARSTVTDKLLARQASVIANEWVQLLQAGDVEKAFELTTTSRQPPPKAPPGAPEPEAPAVPPIENFRQDPVVHFLLDHAQEARVTFVRDEIVDPAAIYNARIQQLYEVAAPPPEASGAATTKIEIILQRSRGYGNAPAEWLVAAYRSEHLPADHAHDAHAGHAH
jgi:hypothetical protein